MISLSENASDALLPQTETAGEAIGRVAAALGLSVQWKFVPLSQSRNAKPGKDGKIWRSLNWRATISRNGRAVLEGIDYSQGEAHCPAYKLPKQDGRFQPRRFGQVQSDAIRDECESGQIHKIANGHPVNTRKPINSPEFADLLASMAMDSSVLDYATFEQWAPDLGFDPDSREGEKIYRLCLSQALALRAAIGEAGIEQLRDAAQDY